MTNNDRRLHLPDRSSNVTEGEVLYYAPSSHHHSGGEEEDVMELGHLRRAAYFYTNKLGQNFTLVLALSLAYQCFIGIFVGVRAIRYLPVLSWLPQDNAALNLVGLVAGVILGVLFQLLIIAESAQFAWIYRPDRLKNQLMQSSSWWWLIGLVLLGVTLVDFLMIFMGITGTVNLGDSWNRTLTDNMTLIVNSLIMALTLLTLLRCAVVMRTTTVEQNKKLVEEQIQTIAEELFLGSGEATKKQAQAVWRKLNVDPSRFIPLQEAVIAQIAVSHPHLLNPQLGGDTWAYDFTGNTFVALPPDLHQALAAGRRRALKSSQSEMHELWSLTPQELAYTIAYNLQTLGKPRVVDATDPEMEPEYIYQPPNLAAIAPNSPRLSPSNLSAIKNRPVGTTVEPEEADPLQDQFADQEAWWLAVPKKHKTDFYRLLGQAYLRLKGAPFNENIGLRLYEEFSLNQLKYYYEQFLQAKSISQ